jgi:cytochrome c oxidase subunit 4
MSHPVITPKTYLVIFVSLISLTALTYGLPHLVHIGYLEIPVALGIASIKTTLVVLFFMHLLYSSRLTWLVVAGAVLFLAILLGLTMADYTTRGMLPQSSVPPAPARP